MLPLVAPAYNDADRAAVAEASAHLEDGEAYVARLEARLADHFGAVGAVCTTSGTAALHLALMALGWVRPAFSSYSCEALMNVATRWKMRDLALVDPEAMLYGTEWLDDGAIVVHQFGVLSPRPRKDTYIEDWAQAFGASPHTIYGRCAIVSFGPSKIVSGQGGGAVIVNDPPLLHRIRDLNSYEKAVADERTNPSPHFQRRVNHRMGGLMSSLVLSQMDRLPQFIERRHQVAHFYNSELSGMGLRLPIATPPGSVFGRYVFSLDGAMLPLDFLSAMMARGVECGRGVYPACHQLAGYVPSAFPNTEAVVRNTVALPIHNGLSDADVELVAAAAVEVLHTNTQ